MTRKLDRPSALINRDVLHQTRPSSRGTPEKPRVHPDQLAQAQVPPSSRDLRGVSLDDVLELFGDRLNQVDAALLSRE